MQIKIYHMCSNKILTRHELEFCILQVEPLNFSRAEDQWTITLLAKIFIDCSCLAFPFTQCFQFHICPLPYSN